MKTGCRNLRVNKNTLLNLPCKLSLPGGIVNGLDLSLVKFCVDCQSEEFGYI